MTENGFWDDHESAQKVIDETNSLKDKFDNFKELSQSLEDLQVTSEF